jgi:hypothetical protein
LGKSAQHEKSDLKMHFANILKSLIEYLLRYNINVCIILSNHKVKNKECGGSESLRQTNCTEVQLKKPINTPNKKHCKL